MPGTTIDKHRFGDESDTSKKVKDSVHSSPFTSAEALVKLLWVETLALSAYGDEKINLGKGRVVNPE